MNVSLAVTYHDPQGRLYDQIVRTLPRLMDIFGGVAVRASGIAYPPALETFTRLGAQVKQAMFSGTGAKIGQARREALALALSLDLPFILYCDCDRALHWAEQYPQELAEVAARICGIDFTVLGRTPRAFDSHPRTQRDTEAIINEVYARVSGNAWDVGAASRGLSRRAAAAILEHCPDVEISTDVSWPLFIQQQKIFSQNYLATEGLEFETADAFPAEVAGAGNYWQWLAQLDADPGRWAERLDLARVEVEAMIPFARPKGQ
jgi:hypothetical protein